MDKNQSAIQRAKEEEASAKEEWLRAMKMFAENSNNETLEYADDCRTAWKIAEMRVAQLEGRG